MVVVQSESELFQVVGTLHPSCRFSRGLNGGQQQGDQHADDGNDDEKFHEGETRKLYDGSTASGRAFSRAERRECERHVDDPYGKGIEGM